MADQLVSLDRLAGRETVILMAVLSSNPLLHLGGMPSNAPGKRCTTLHMVLQSLGLWSYLTRFDRMGAPRYRLLSPVDVFIV